MQPVRTVRRRCQWLRGAGPAPLIPTADPCCGPARRFRDSLPERESELQNTPVGPTKPLKTAENRVDKGQGLALRIAVGSGLKRQMMNAEE